MPNQELNSQITKERELHEIELQVPKQTDIKIKQTGSKIHDRTRSETI